MYLILNDLFFSEIPRQISNCVNVLEHIDNEILQRNAKYIDLHVADSTCK